MNAPGETELRLPIRERMHEVIFEADTPLGKLFDVVLIWTIIASVVTVMIESVGSIAGRYGLVLRVAEWVFTGLFTIEYGLRLWSVRRPLRYATSFFGLVDLAAILPSFLSLIIPGGQALISVRALRLLRVFRVFKLAYHVKEARLLMRGLKATRYKLTVFVLTVITLVVILGSAIYLVEGAEHGFTSIPRSVYWAIVTITTVGYGDIAPATPVGQLLASMVMIIGYAIIAVPAGIVTVELDRAMQKDVSTQACQHCSLQDHDRDAKFCKHCGEEL